MSTNKTGHTAEVTEGDREFCERLITDYVGSWPSNADAMEHCESMTKERIRKIKSEMEVHRSGVIPDDNYGLTMAWVRLVEECLGEIERLEARNIVHRHNAKFWCLCYFKKGEPLPVDCIGYDEAVKLLGEPIPAGAFISHDGTKYVDVYGDGKVHDVPKTTP